MGDLFQSASLVHDCPAQCSLLSSHLVVGDREVILSAQREEREETQKFSLLTTVDILIAP